MDTIGINYMEEGMMVAGSLSIVSKEKGNTSRMEDRDVFLNDKPSQMYAQRRRNT